MFAYRKLAIVLTATAMLASTSAFAETRHRDATDSNDGSWRTERSDRNSGDRAQRQVQTEQLRRSDQDRSRGNDQQYQNRNDSNRSYSNRNDQYRNDNRRYQDRNDHRQYQDRNENRDRSYSYGRAESYDRGRAYSMHGRVSRIEPWNGGYRVWIGGGYPFFVTDSWWHLHRLAIGADIALGGYWNPGGYYDVYDYPYGYNTSGDLRGVVESVDYRRGTMVLRDDISGNFVTTILRGNDPRLGDLRPGDYVDLTGEWSRAGVFNAYNVADLRDGRGYDNRY